MKRDVSLYEMKPICVWTEICTYRKRERSLIGKWPIFMKKRPIFIWKETCMRMNTDLYIHENRSIYVCRHSTRRTKRDLHVCIGLFSFFTLLCVGLFSYMFRLLFLYTDLHVYIYMYICIYIHVNIGPAWGGQEKKNKQTQTYLHMKRDLYINTWKRAVQIWRETYTHIYRPCGRRTRKTRRPRLIHIWRETCKYPHEKELYINGKRLICIYTGPAWGGQGKQADPDLSTYEVRPVYIHEKTAIHKWRETYMYIRRPCVRRTRKTSRPRLIYIWRETYMYKWKKRCAYMERDQHIYIQALREAGKQNTQTQTFLLMNKKNMYTYKKSYIYI